MTSGDDRFSDLPPNPFAAPLAEEKEGHVAPTEPGELSLNPWVSILTEPTLTIRQIVRSNPAHCVVILSCLLGVVSLLGINDGREESAYLPLTMLLPVALIGGPILGLLIIYVSAAVLRISAKVLSGVASYAEMRAAYAWSAVPAIYAAPLTLLTAIVTSPEGAEPGSPTFSTVAALNLAASAIAGIWSFIISLNTIAEVNHFSRLKAFGAMILPGFVFVVLAFVVLAFTASL
ncbi:MAG: Yip1 family protein [Planctomycetota bacterium]